MPAKSKTQQRLLGWAHSCASDKNDNCPPNVKKVASSFKKSKSGLEGLKDFAKTPHKGLPEKKKKNENLLRFDDFIKEELESEHNYFTPFVDQFNRFMYETNSFEKLDTPIHVGSIVNMTQNSSILGMVTKMSDINGKYPYYATVEFFSYPQMDGSYSTDERSTAKFIHLNHIKLNEEPEAITQRKRELKIGGSEWIDLSGPDYMAEDLTYEQAVKLGKLANPIKDYIKIHHPDKAAKLLSTKPGAVHPRPLQLTKVKILGLDKFAKRASDVGLERLTKTYLTYHELINI